MEYYFLRSSSSGCPEWLDETGVLCEAFDVIKQKNMYGKKFMGIERSTFIIDESGNIVREYRKISLAGHAEFILEEVKSLTV